jgi:NADP-dependent aldehyde dehydrogenase
MSSQHFQAVNPADGLAFGATYPEQDRAEVEATIARTFASRGAFAELGLAARAKFLETIGAELEGSRAGLVEIAHLETGLPEARINGEISRTVIQLQLFAAMVRTGKHLAATIDLADPDYKPVARPDMRKVNLPIGVVAVFGASNFPFAYSVIGGDSAAALAAGCPVVVKAHPSHPGTSLLTYQAVQSALAKEGLSGDIFTMVQGRSPEITHWIALDEKVSAIGFTGSALVGKLLVDLSHSRKTPIPVFAEMGSLNPIFVTAKALAERGSEIGGALFDSVTLGSGQFCTKPGLIFLGAESEDFLTAMRENMKSVGDQQLLNKGIAERYNNSVSDLAKISGVESIVGHVNEIGFRVPATLFVLDYATYKSHPEFSHEHFGPTTVIVKAAESDFAEIVAQSEGNLTATLHLGTDEKQTALVNALSDIAGRLILNGAPTGVSVTAAQNHGGPWPSSSTHTTSVGTDAIYRFMRPVSYQGFPDELLPPALTRTNPEGIVRLTNGVLGLE